MQPIATLSNRARILSCLLICAVLPLSWLMMMVVHELGHVLAAWVSGGAVATVVVHPLTISRTDLAQNPHPLFVAWAGPVFGAIGPLVAWGIGHVTRWAGTFLLRFFAGFCLIANGLYLSIGSFDYIGDAGTILMSGSPVWTLWLFGAVTVPTGLGLWHRLGPQFGIGGDAQPVRAATVYSVLTLLFVVVVATAVLSG